jgi:hypothetical protein
VESERNDVVLAPRVVPGKYQETYDGSWTTAAGQARSAGEAVNHGQAGLYDAAQVGAANVEAGGACTKPAESGAKAFLAEITCGGTAREATRRTSVRRVADRRRLRRIRHRQKTERPLRHYGLHRPHLSRQKPLPHVPPGQCVS